MAVTTAAVASAVQASRVLAAADASVVPVPPRVYVNDPQQTSVHAWWQPDPSIGSAHGGGASSFIRGLRLYVREFPKPWSAARTLDLPRDAREVTVTGLAPTATYQLRLAYILAGSPAAGPDATTVSAPGPEATADTAAAGCVPSDEQQRKERNKRCSLQ